MPHFLKRRAQKKKGERRRDLTKMGKGLVTTPPLTQLAVAFLIGRKRAPAVARTHNMIYQLNDRRWKKTKFFLYSNIILI